MVFKSVTLPVPLLALSLLSLGQAQQLLLNVILPLTLNASSPSIALDLPDTTHLQVSVAVCSANQPFPNFIVTGALDGGGEQIELVEGIGTWSGGGTKLQISLGAGTSSSGTWPVEVGVSSGDPLHRNLTTFPVLGDTTATQALLFSPPYLPPLMPQPSYPNYTLPSGNLTLPPPPPASSQPNFTLVLSPTTQIQEQPGFKLSLSACAIRETARGVSGSVIGLNGTSGVNVTSSVVLRDISEGQGWRTQWLVEGLTSNTNYTAWVIQDGGAVAGPIFVFTKSSSFSCHLAHSLPFCPSTAYAVPLPPPADGGTTYTASNLPPSITSPLISILSNFTTALLTFPCGRDSYSPLQTCQSCSIAYRTWACAVSLPRCGEVPPALAVPHANITQPRPAIITTPSRNNNINSTVRYSELLPCLETCHAVDRACPPLFGWRCPQVGITAEGSYGVGFIDGADGGEGDGFPGVAQDRFGVSWCNG
ncbi:stretch-activated Ca2+-permeable channel component-domain-containing protein [Hysterangium stoloniferum]|nr:stretch-activated Ca2+-permeable channel component-domain-containing protein [Hysterangium stoloniferum]